MGAGGASCKIAGLLLRKTAPEAKKLLPENGKSLK